MDFDRAIFQNEPMEKNYSRSVWASGTVSQLSSGSRFLRIQPPLVAILEAHFILCYITKQLRPISLELNCKDDVIN